MKLPICPYCGRKPSYFRILAVKTKCDYICPHCRRESKIDLNSDYKIPFFIALGISVIIILSNMLSHSTDNLWLLAFSFAPMAAACLIIPFFINLRPYLKYRDVVCERLKKQSKGIKRKGAG